MSSSSVEKIKEKLDIIDVVGSYVKLEKAGASYKGKCPFHNEKTPSFFVSPDRGNYYCFGCGAKGDIFTFVQEFEGLDFIGALKELAGRAGVELEPVSFENKSEQDELKNVLERATVIFEENLKNSVKAKEYLLSRGLREETISLWRLGYAPLEWRNLSDKLKLEKYSQSTILRAGLIKKSETAGSPYDVFRGRIMFPIFDGNGKVIAFSGRLFDDQPEAPKYLNSPETEIFLKSDTLYGLDKAKVNIRKKGYSILVEGQMDIIMSHQEGFDNTVATSGTALTIQHLERLRRLSQKVMMVFDGDSAGIVAAQKSAEFALSIGMESKIALLPNGKDPADALKDGKEEFSGALRSAKHVIDFCLEKILKEVSDRRTIGIKIKEQVLPLISKLGSKIEQSHFVSSVAKRSGIKEDAIWADLKVVHPGEPKESAIERDVGKEISKKNSYIARRLWGIIEWQSTLENPYIDPKSLKEKIEKIVGEARLSQMEAEQKAEIEKIIFEAESYYGTKEALEKDLPELLLNFEEDVIREELTMMMKKLQDAEGTKDQSAVQEITERITELIKRKNELSIQRKNL